jgi:hypothetical protein
MNDKIIIADQTNRKKFLCVCEGGNVRSASLALILKCHFNQDAIAIGWRFASPETLKMLCEWATYIVVMQKIFVEKIPKVFLSKVRVVDVGEDKYGTPMHHELTTFLNGVVEEWEERKFEI